MDSNKPNLAEWIIFPIVSVLCGLALLQNAAPFWWMGAGLITAGIATLFSYHGQRQSLSSQTGDDSTWLGPKWRTRALDLMCVIAIALVVVLMLPEVSKGNPPINKDHTVHFVKAWQLQDAFLGQGRLWGWSHQWFAGYPAQYLYPIGSDLMVLGVRALSLGILSLEQAYAVAFWLHFVLLGYGMFRCATQNYSRSVGLIAALLFITDIGAFRMGGWVFTAQWGVWPMSLSLAFGLLAIAQLDGVLKGDRWSHVAWFGLWMGLALLVHPIQLIHFGVVLPVAIVVRWLVYGGSRWLFAVGRALLGGSIGLSIGGIWLFPFFANQNYAQSYGAPWWDTFRMGKGIYSLDLLQGTWAAIIALGVIGLFVMLFSRRFYPLLFGVLSFTLLLTCSSSFLQGFHLIDFAKSLQNIQFQRFAVLLKPYLFIACAVSVVVLFRFLAHQHSQSMEWEDEESTESSEKTDGTDAAKENESSKDAEVEKESTEQVDGKKESKENANEETEALSPAPSRESENVSGPWRIYARYLLVGFLAAPILYPLVSQYLEKHVKHIHRRNIRDSVDTERDDNYRMAKKAFVAWAKVEFPKARKQGFFRLALYVGKHTHTFFLLGQQLNTPVYKVGFTPSTNFRFKMDKSSVPLFKALNVRYVISRWRLSSRKYKLLRRFGKLYLYEFLFYQPNPFRVVAGKGQVKLKKFEDENIVLEAGAGSKGQLRLNVSYFPRWSVTHNGKPMGISLSQVEGSKQTGFMTVPLKPGVYHFRFRRGLVEWMSLLVFFFGFLFVGGLFYADLRPNPSGWLQESLEQFKHGLVGVETRFAYPIRLGLVASLMVVAGIGIGLALWNPGQQYKHPMLQNQSFELGYSFLDNLKQAKAFKGIGNKPCRLVLSRWVCGPDDWQHIYVKQVRLSVKTWKRCVWMHPQRHTPVTLRFDKVVVGNAITGYFGIAKTGFRRGKAPVSFRVRVNGMIRYRGQTMDDAKTYHYKVNLPPTLQDKPVQVEFQVEARNTGKRHFCFHAQGIRLK